MKINKCASLKLEVNQENKVQTENTKKIYRLYTRLEQKTITNAMATVHV